MPTSNEQKRCFVIGPISEPGTDIRRKADWLLKGIIRPVLEDASFKYEVKRADDFPEPGMITGQVITAVLEWDLVVADLTGANANAFYELALRHMAELPVIHMIEEGSKLPFDVSDYRTVPYSIDDFESVEEAKRRLKAQVQAINSAGFEVSNPVTKARGYQRLAHSSDSTEQMLAGVVEKLASLETKVEQISDTPRTKTFSGSALAALFGDENLTMTDKKSSGSVPPPSSHSPPRRITTPGVTLAVRPPPPPKK